MGNKQNQIKEDYALRVSHLRETGHQSLGVTRLVCFELVKQFM